MPHIINNQQITTDFRYSKIGQGVFALIVNRILKAASSICDDCLLCIVTKPLICNCLYKPYTAFAPTDSDSRAALFIRIHKINNL